MDGSSWEGIYGGENIITNRFDDNGLFVCVDDDTD
jgi:hypothetical protein